MIKKINNIKNRQEGVAAIEFALILPVLVLIIFGIIEFGLLLFNKQVITNASREGARYGIIVERPAVPQIIEEVDDYCKDYLISFGSAFPVTNVESGACANFQDDLIVDVSYRYDFLFLPIDWFVPSDMEEFITLRARTVMKCE